MTDDFAQRCRAAAVIGTGPVSDAMELLGLPRSAITGWRHIAREPGVAFVGPAYTLRQGPKGPHVPHDDSLTRQRDAAATLARPGDVLVIDVNGRTDICTWGENLALAALANGVAGLVVHGAVRDSEAIRRTGFPVLCRGVSPVTSRWDLATAALNETLSIDGVQIHPGDIIYADADGVLVIPRDQALAVFDRAAAIHATEEKKRRDLYGDRAP